MVERVARALSVADGMHPEAVSNDEDQVPAWTLYIQDARAAIEAMRKPTEAMRDAGTSAHSSADTADAVHCFTAMIEAALNADPNPLAPHQ